MSAPGYNNTIKQEAAYVQSLGQTATEDNIQATYRAILNHWFPSERGYLIDRRLNQSSSKYKFIVVQPGKKRNPVLVLELEQLSSYSDTGKAGVVAEIKDVIEDLFNHSEYDAIYGLGGIGLNWTVCRMQKNGEAEPTTIQDWTTNITSDESYHLFQNIAEMIYNMS